MSSQNSEDMESDWVISRRKFLKFSFLLFGSLWIGEVPFLRTPGDHKIKSIKNSSDLPLGPLGDPRLGCSTQSEEIPNFPEMG